MKTIITTLILSFSLPAFAGQWECTGFANKHFVLTSQNKGAMVKTYLSDNAKSSNPRKAVIQKLDPAMDGTSGEKNICNVEKILNVKFPAKENKVWPSHYAWIHHWELVDGKIKAKTTYYENISLQNFNDTYNQKVQDEVWYDFKENNPITGCFYECSQK